MALARGAPQNWGFHFNIYTMAEARDFKFGTQLRFAEACQNTTPKGKVGQALGNGGSHIFGVPLYYFFSCCAVFLAFAEFLVCIHSVIIICVQSLTDIVRVLDPDGNGSINFVQFSEGVKRIMNLHGSPIFTVCRYFCCVISMYFIVSHFSVFIAWPHCLQCRALY